MAEPPNLTAIHGGGGGGGETAFGGGGSGGGGMDRGYLDARIEAVKSQSDAAYTKLEAKIDGIQPGATWQQIAGILFVAVTGAFGVLAYASDRFDGGVSASSIADAAVERVSEGQQLRDETQDKMLDRILNELERINAKPETSPTGQD